MQTDHCNKPLQLRTPRTDISLAHPSSIFTRVTRNRLLTRLASIPVPGSSDNLPPTGLVINVSLMNIMFVCLIWISCLLLILLISQIDDEVPMKYSGGAGYNAMGTGGESEFQWIVIRLWGL